MVELQFMEGNLRVTEGCKRVSFPRGTDCASDCWFVVSRVLLKVMLNISKQGESICDLDIICKFWSQYEYSKVFIVVRNRKFHQH